MTPDGWCVPEATKRPAPVAKTPRKTRRREVGNRGGCPEGQHRSAGQCCSNGTEWVPSLSSCRAIGTESNRISPPEYDIIKVKTYNQFSYIAPRNHEWIHLKIRLVFGDNVSELSDEHRGILQEGAKVFRNRSDIMMIRCEGHCSRNEIGAKNTDYAYLLAMKRAVAACDYFSRNGLPRKKLESVSFGYIKQSEPIYQSQKVEFSILVRRR